MAEDQIPDQDDLPYGVVENFAARLDWIRAKDYADEGPSGLIGEDALRALATQLRSAALVVALMDDAGAFLQLPEPVRYRIAELAIAQDQLDALR